VGVVDANLLGIEIKVGGAAPFFIFFTIVIGLVARTRRWLDGGQIGGFFSDRVRSMKSFNESAVSPFEEEQDDPPLDSSCFRAAVGAQKFVKIGRGVLSEKVRRWSNWKGINGVAFFLFF